MRLPLLPRKKKGVRQKQSPVMEILVASLLKDKKRQQMDPETIDERTIIEMPKMLENEVKQIQ